MEVFNVLDGPLDGPDAGDPPGFRPRSRRLGPALGASRLGGTVYELAPGEAICPYHYEYGNEEWLIVCAGSPALRTPDGERTLRPGDAVCFPEGPAGAHTVRGGVETARVLMHSTRRMPHVSVYPDSGKIGVWPGVDDDTKIFRRADAVDYFEGEGGGSA